MTTVLHGNQEVTVDALGQRLPQSVHGARVPLEAPASTSGATPRTRSALAGSATPRPSSRSPRAARRASRSRSSRRSCRCRRRGPCRAHRRGPRDLRPDMGDVVEDWGDVFPARNRSRFVVDGGVLANTPTRAARRGDRADAGRRARCAASCCSSTRTRPSPAPTRPTPSPTPPPSPAPSPACWVPCRPRAAAPSSTSSRSTTSGPRAAGAPAPTCSAGSTSRWQTREVQRLEQLGGQLFPHYRRLRIWHAARDLARRQVRRSARPSRGPAQGEVWDYERIRRAAERAQQAGRGRAPRACRRHDPPPDLRPSRTSPTAYPTLVAPDDGDRLALGGHRGDLGGRGRQRAAP